VSALYDSPDSIQDVGTPLPSAFVEPDASAEYSGPMIDLSSIKQAASRRRKLWIGAALAGLVVGAAFHLFVPAKYAAATDLYMVEPAASAPGEGIANDVSLLETRSVAEQALSTLHLDVNPSVFLSTYAGTAVSGVILSIKLSAASPADAAAYDNAVAHAFLTVRAQELALQTDLIVNGLGSQVDSLNADTTELSSEINSLSAAKPGPQSTNQITQLVNQRSNDASEILQLQSEQQQDLLDEKAAAQGSRVLDPAETLTVSDNRVIVTDGLSGLVAGLGIGMGIVIVGAVISERPRRRSEIAAALGVPIELSVGRYRPPRLLRHLRLRRVVRKPGHTLPVVEHRLRDFLESLPNPSLAVVPVGSVEPVALCTAALAFDLASEGKSVVVVDMSEGRPLSWLMARHARRAGCFEVAVNGQGLTLVVAPEEPSEEITGPSADVDVVLVLASVSPAFGAEHIAAWATDAVVIVTAGEATTTIMTTSTQLLARAGISTSWALLIGAEASDETVGAVGDGPYPSHERLPDKQPEDGFSTSKSELYRGRER
jgi:capsular polysaccharide biosynthesis protein